MCMYVDLVIRYVLKEHANILSCLALNTAQNSCNEATIK